MPKSSSSSLAPPPTARVPYRSAASSRKGGNSTITPPSLHRLRPLLLLPLVLVTTFFARTVVPPQSAAASSESIRRGAELFTQTGCIHCHGTAREGTERGPDLTQVRKHLKPEAIAAQIHDGGKSMPPFGDQLTPQQIADLVDFLRSKQK